jgi:hypothetical protein
MKNKHIIIVQIEAIISSGIERDNNKNRKNKALNPVKISHIIEVIFQYPILYRMGNNKTIENNKNEKIVNTIFPIKMLKQTQ